VPCLLSNALECAVCCSVLQCVAMCCNVLQCVEVCCSHGGAPQFKGTLPRFESIQSWNATLEVLNLPDFAWFLRATKELTSGQAHALIYTHTHAHTQTHTHTHTFTYTHSHTLSLSHTHTHTHTHIHTHAYTHTNTNKHAYSRYHDRKDWRIFP